jgi:hypothetical protein
MDEVYLCEACDWPYESPLAARRCAEFDDLESD